MLNLCENQWIFFFCCWIACFSLWQRKFIANKFITSSEVLYLKEKKKLDIVKYTNSNLGSRLELMVVV